MKVTESYKNFKIVANANKGAIWGDFKLKVEGNDTEDVVHTMKKIIDEWEKGEFQETWNGFNLRINSLQGIYYGFARGEIIIKINSKNREEVIRKLKNEIEFFLINKNKIISRNRRDRHKEFLYRKGIVFKGVRNSEEKKNRSSHCYKCKNAVSSEIQDECIACEWIICNCGACGCGYSWRL